MIFRSERETKITRLKDDARNREPATIEKNSTRTRKTLIESWSHDNSVAIGSRVEPQDASLWIAPTIGDDLDESSFIVTVEECRRKLASLSNLI